MPASDPILDALRLAQGKQPMATRLDTAGLRELSAEIRASAYFTARGTSLAYASKIEEVIRLLAGDSEHGLGWIDPRHLIAQSG